MKKYIRTTMTLGVAILLLAAALFLVDLDRRAAASPLDLSPGTLSTSEDADTCSTSGLPTRTFSTEVMAQIAAIPNGEKIDPILVERLQSAQAIEFYVILTEQADLSKAAELSDKDARTAYVYEQLTSIADKTQLPLLSYLDSRAVAYRSMYIQNMIRVEAAGLAEIEWLAARSDVAQIEAPPEAQIDPVWKAMTPEQRVEAIEWNIIRVHAPEVWAMGYNGEGYVVASNDTGVEYTHPALVGKYRGNLGGGNFDHNYNWWDGLGGYEYPYDYDGHGTHTTGTMVGDDGAGNQIGVAPGAQWIACGGLGGTDPLDCFQFFLTPWDLDGLNPDPSKAPDSINNSWYDPSGFDYRPIIQTLNAAGIAVIKSAGNNGPNCSTISNPGYVPEIIATAAFAQGDTIASFSSRGPSSYYGETILKPEVAAPGVNVRSSVPGGGYEGGWSGTSMAAPHTTALVALMWQAAPCIAGDVPLTKQIMMETAEAKIDAQCTPFVDHPNDVWGWGILDDEAAVQAAMALCGGTGYLDGTVTESVGNSPLEGVEILAVRSDGYNRMATTNASGYYTTTALAGTYTVTADLFAYYPQEVTGVVIITDTVTTQDFVMVPLPEYIISGTVTEAGTGLPLYAEISLVDTPISPIWTDPGTGYYSLTDVPTGTYTIRAEAALHLAEEREVVVDGNLTEDFALETLPCILLVDDDQDNPDVQSYYTQALDQLGLDYAVWDTAIDGDPSAADLDGYIILIWFNGYPYSDTFNAANEAAVAEFLDNGGKFLFSSQDYLYDMGLTTFGTGYLHIASFDSDVSQTTVTGANPFSGLGPYTLSYPFTNYSDMVNPDGSGMVAFTGNQGNAAVAYDGVFETVFLGFPFEAISTLGSRADVLQAAVDFFGGCVCEPVYDTTFTYEPLDPFAYQVVTFTGDASGTQPIDYAWDFGDGESATGQVVTHTYSVSGDYTVLLDTSNACGVDSYSALVMIAGAPDIALNPGEFELTLVTGQTASLSLSVMNDGGSTLNFEISESPVVDWLTVDPDTGNLLPGDSLTTTLSFDTGSLDAGVYTTTLKVSSNDPLQPLVDLPVTLTVLANPQISLSSYTYEVYFMIGGSGLVNLLVSNTGDLALTFDITESPSVDWLLVDPKAGELQADETLTVTLDFNTDTLDVGVYTTTLQVGSNDPLNPLIDVPVTMIVLDLPVEGLAADNDSPTPLGRLTTLSASITGGTNVLFVWDFGDGEFGTGQVVTHFYPALGDYTATVTAYNTFNELFASTLVTISEPYYESYLPLVSKVSP